LMLSVPPTKKGWEPLVYTENDLILSYFIFWETALTYLGKFKA
jgi:hypothetical protein